MAGRFPYWHQRAGAIAAPAALLNLGRKLLAQLRERQRLGAPPTLELRQTIPEGTAIARMIAGRAHVAYQPALPQDEQPRVPAVPAGIVVTARRRGLADGIRDGKPQQILHKDRAERWHVYAFDRNIHPDARADGTYRAAFPDGIEHAGNIDWRSAEGVWINWYGPSMRYWYDLWRRPEAQYGRWVFLNGSILLDIDAYAAENEIAIAERYVLGAALVGTYLYVMQARINDFADPDLALHPTRPYAWISPPYPNGTTDLRLARYAIARNPQPAGNADLFRIVPGSMLTLWTHTGRGWVNPWVFSPDGTRCESFAMPDELRDISHNDLTVSPAVVTRYHDWSASSEHLALTIDHEQAQVSATADVLSVEHTFGANPGAVRYPIAADYARDGTRRVLYVEIDNKPDASNSFYVDVVVRIDNQPGVPLWINSPDYERHEWAVMQEINIRDGRVCTLHSFRTTRAGHYLASWRVYRDGALISDQPISFDGQGLAARIWSASAGTRSIPWYRGGFEPALFDGKPLSPLTQLFGVQVVTATSIRLGITIRQSIFWFPYAYYGAERTPNDELRGWYATWENTLSYVYPPVPLAGYEVVMGADAYSLPVDTLGMRVFVSGVESERGDTAVSFTSTPTVTAWDRYFGKVAVCNYCSDQRLSDLTGIAGSEGPIHVNSGLVEDAGPPLNFPFDARFSTIWMLGKWPRI